MQRNRKLVVVSGRDDSPRRARRFHFHPFVLARVIAEQLPYNFMMQEHEKLGEQWNQGLGSEEHKPVFSLIHDATTDWGQQVSAEVAEDKWSVRR